jgi:hypothetical protein
MTVSLYGALNSSVEISSLISSFREIRASRAMRPTLAWGSSRVTGKPIGLFRAMTPLARDGPKLRPEILPLARVPGETLDLGRLVPVVLSGPHAALPRF